MSKVLIYEDEPKLAELMSAYLEASQASSKLPTLIRVVHSPGQLYKNIFKVRIHSTMI